MKKGFTLRRLFAVGLVSFLWKMTIMIIAGIEVISEWPWWLTILFSFLFYLIALAFGWFDGGEE